MKKVQVAVGVVKRDLHFFVCRRKSHQHQGGKWEFPGGKLDAGESAEQALTRELKEEIGITVLHASHLLDIEFVYPDKRVELLVYLVTDFTGSAHGAEDQECQWVDFAELQTLEFPAANKQIIEHLASTQ